MDKGLVPGEKPSHKVNVTAADGGCECMSIRIARLSLLTHITVFIIDFKHEHH